jgi:hypothetical protein
MKAFAPLSRTLPFWPGDLFGPPGGMLDVIGITDFDIDTSSVGLAFSGKVAWLEEIELEVPAINGASFALLDAGGFTEVGFNLALQPELSLTLGELFAEFRFKSEALRPVTLNATTQKWEPLLDSTTLGALPAAFKIGQVYLHVDGEGQIAFVDAAGQPTAPAITAPALELAGSGIVLELQAVQLYLSDKQTPPPSAQPGFKGVAISQAKIHLGDAFGSAAAPDVVTISDLVIGSSGFGGSIAATWNHQINADGTYSGHGMGELFGLKVGLKSLQFTFSQNKLVGSAIKAVLTLPYFDHPLDVTIGFDAKGGLTIGIDATGGIFTLKKPGFLEVAVESLAIAVADKKAKVAISGAITPLFGGLNWPSFEVRELSIDSEGKVELQGGWIDLPSQVALNFHAFTVQINKFGMGKKDNARWFGCACTVNLIKGVQGKGSVEGLRLFLYDDGSVGFSFEGISIEMKMGGAFDLKGSGRFIDEPGNKRFDGAAMLALKKPELAFDTQLTIGRRDDPIEGKYPYFGVYAGLELPFGITPFPAIPLSIYGFVLMFAMHMRPGRKPDQAWYALPPTEGWYNRTPVGVEKLTKWEPKKDAKAIGLGATIGTVGGGYPFNMKGLLVVSFPGTVIFLQSMANICKPRKELGSGDQPLFRSIAVLDFAAGEYTFGLDAFYKYDAASGAVVDIRGSAEAFYGKNSDPPWHVYVGDEPAASRVHAKIISIFEATAYFKLDPHGIRMGSWVGYDKSWHPSPLSVTLQAWLDTNAAVSFKPPHFHTDLWMHAAIELSAFGFGAGLSADALLAADVKDPFHIKGELAVSLKVPKPFKSPSATVGIEFGPRATHAPVSTVLKGIGIEHLKSSAVWPLAVGQALVPDHDDGRGFLVDPPPPAPSEPPPSALDIVPMDGVISVAFASSVHDDSQIGVNAVMPSPDYVRIGDPAKNEGPARVRYALKGMRLEKKDTASASWVGVAGKGPGSDSLPPLYGAWGAIPGPGAGQISQTNLMVFAKNAFVQNRLTGDSWNDAFAAGNPHYPCVKAPPLTCYHFDGYDPGLIRGADGALADLRHRDNPALFFRAVRPGFAIEPLVPPVNGRSHMLHTAFRNIGYRVSIEFAKLPAPIGIVHIVFDTDERRTLTVREEDRAAVAGSRSLSFAAREITLSAAGGGAILAVEFDQDQVGIVEVCVGSPEVAELRALADNLKSATSHWAHEDNVLEPFTQYRLTIATEAHVIEDAGATATHAQTSFAYFKTGGPPGLGSFTVPAGQTPDTIAGGPDNLANYVAQTVPATIGRGDDAPAMPRPVFCAYDMGVDFNCNYPDMLYKMARCDLMLQVFDSNGEPARDAIGRGLTFENPWGVTSKLELDDASAAWLAAIDPNCVPIDQSTIVHNKILATRATPVLLAPLTRYRARLVPLLLHEDFAAPHYGDGAAATGGGGLLDDWLVVELDTPALGSRWTVHNAASPNGIYVEQDIAQPGSATSASDCPPGSALVWTPAAVPKWTRHRLAVFVQAGAGGAVGALFLYQGPSSYYAVNLYPGGLCRLVHRTPAGLVKLAEAPASFVAGTDSELVVEIAGDAIRIFLDGAPVLRHDLDLKAHVGGTIGLWCWDNGSARFKDVRVEDQRAGALVAFGFDFVTSGYVNYAHLALGRRTPVWDVETAGGDKARTAAELMALASASVQQSDAPLSATEIRQYEDFVALWLGPKLVRDPATPEVNLIRRGAEALGWLVRSPEPWTWTRSEISLWQSPQEAPLSYLLGPVKIVGAALGMTIGDDEYVDLLGLDDTDLAGWRLQLRDASADPGGLIDAPFDDPASIWSDLYLFPSQATVAAGLRLRLFSGGMVQPPANHTWRTMNLAQAGDPGVSRLPAVGADLRLLDESGRTACAVRILPDSAFTLVQPAPKLLRKADATGLIILPNAGQAMSPGAYRLRMAYRRDLSKDEPDTIILSQAGDSSDELAFLPLY